MTDGIDDGQGKQLLSQVTEHMEVVGSDEQPLGKVDTVKGDQIILTKSDSPDGRHHAFPSRLIERVANDRLILNCSADDARQEFSEPDRDQALSEGDDQGEDGPHILDRSFSGTY